MSLSSKTLIVKENNHHKQVHSEGDPLDVLNFNPLFQQAIPIFVNVFDYL